jgi:hypothetical protein
MFEVDITNFQSIKNLSLKFEGFTTIVGRNFIGKSASLRAINAALTNQQGTDFIRWGEKFCEVKIKTTDIELLWHKESGNNFYKINNEDVYDKVGNQPPPKPLIDAGFGLLNVGKEKINLFYAEQFFPLFLVDRLDTKSADLLISIYGLDKLYKAIDLCARDQRENSNLCKLRKNDFDQAEKDLERFEDFDKVKIVAKSLDDEKIKLNKKYDDIFGLKSWFYIYEKNTEEIKRFKPVKSIEIPSYISIEKNIVECDKIKNFLSDIQDIKKDFLRLREVNSIIISEKETSEIESKLSEIKNLRNFQSRYDSLATSVNVLKNIKDIKIPEVPDTKIEFINNLKFLYDKTADLVTDVNKTRSSIKIAGEELIKVDKELSIYDRCPACGSKL